MKTIRTLILLLLLIPTFFSCDKKATETPEQSPMPVFSPAGGTYTDSVLVRIICSTDNAVIRYTTDGTTPDVTSQVYAAPILITSTTTIKAFVSSENHIDSDITYSIYTIPLMETVATPVFSPEGGIYSYPQDITITCDTEGAEIWYSVGGTALLYSGPVFLNHSTTLTARAYKTDMITSNLAEDDYTINYLPSEMVFVAGGLFTMGRTSGNGSPDELPLHQVTLSSFYISRYEITQTEWLIVMNDNPSHFTGNNYRPVESISWYSTLVYCNKRSIQEGKTPAYAINHTTNPDDWGPIPTSVSANWDNVFCYWDANGYRLPTESEWEYAARGATNNPDYIYAGSDYANDVAWALNNSFNETHQVGQKIPNSIGLYDMSGNVLEWCWDWFGGYGSENSFNPYGPDTGITKVLRGGAWNFNDDFARVANREWWGTSFTGNNAGFRVVLANY